MSWYDDFITRTPGVQGGEPVVAGTRTPVRTIAVLYHETYAYDLTKVLASLSHLTPNQVDAALQYYRDHQAEIDALTRGHRQALKEFIAAS